MPVRETGFEELPKPRLGREGAEGVADGGEFAEDGVGDAARFESGWIEVVKRADEAANSSFCRKLESCLQRFYRFLRNGT